MTIATILMGWFAVSLILGPLVGKMIAGSK